MSSATHFASTSPSRSATTVGRGGGARALLRVARGDERELVAPRGRRAAAARADAAASSSGCGVER